MEELELSTLPTYELSSGCVKIELGRRWLVSVGLAYIIQICPRYYLLV